MKKNLVILGLVILLTALFARHVQTVMRLYSAQGKVETIAKLRESALNSTNVSVVIENLDYIQWFCSPDADKGTKSTLDVLVQNYQQSATSEMVGHLRKITGRNLGDDPKDWIDAYNDATNTPAKAP